MLEADLSAHCMETEVLKIRTKKEFIALGNYDLHFANQAAFRQKNAIQSFVSAATNVFKTRCSQVTLFLLGKIHYICQYYYMN